MPNNFASFFLISLSDALIECLAFSVTAKLSQLGSGLMVFFVIISILCPLLSTALEETVLSSIFAEEKLLPTSVWIAYA